MFFNNGWYKKEKPFAGFAGFGGGATGFGFGRGVSRVLIENINPALPGGATTWDLAEGDLVLDTYSSRSFTFADDGTHRITVIGGGSCGGWTQSGLGNLLSAVVNIRMGASGGARVCDVNVTSGTTYWAHVGEGGSRTWPSSNPRTSASVGGGASALTLAPSTTGAEIIVSGGAGGTTNEAGAYANWVRSGPFTTGGPYPFGPNDTERSAGGGGDACPGYPYPPGNAGGGGTAAGVGGAAGANSRSTNATAGGNAPRGFGGRAGDTASSWYGEYGRSGYARGGETGATPGDGPGHAGGGGYAGGGGTNNSSGPQGTGGGGSGYFNPAYGSEVATAQGSQSEFIGDLTQTGQAMWDELNDANNWTNPLPAIYPYLPTTGNNGGAHPKKYGGGGGSIINPGAWGTGPYHYLSVGDGAIIIHKV